LFDWLGLVVVDPDLVKAVKVARARNECGECNDAVATDAEKALADAVIAQADAVGFGRRAALVSKLRGRR
jgi:hypothetical protein